MLKQRREAGQQVADSLFAAEEAIDAALAAVAELNGTLARARRQANMSAVFAQDAFDAAAATFAALSGARAGIVETHKRLSEAQVQAGLRTVSFGDGGKPEETFASSHLRAVG